ncbi:MAG: recombinase family protein [Sphingomonadales bacterium]|nr:recombinase family protein [Sphingomonadales bacterium]MDE2168723.1 recombinase family protein [Sphingomonadales bacterium]
METIIYARFSTLEQRRGDSLRRQLEDCNAYAAAQGWSVITELVDRGRSAFSAANRAAGSALGKFEREVHDGLHEGQCLLVERLDRISREEPKEVFQWLLRMTGCGLTIATVDGNRRYTSADLDFQDIIEIVLKAKVAHEESEKKSQRLAAKWNQKRIAAEEGVAMTAACPAWLRIDKTTGKYVAIPHKAEIIRKIFLMASHGTGTHSIASILNEGNVEHLGRGKTGWRHSYIKNIVSNAAVIGVHQHHQKTATGRVPLGDPIEGYYPAIIEHDLWEKVQLIRAGRATKGRAGQGMTNLLSGIVKCGECGSTVTIVSSTIAGSQRMRRGRLITEPRDMRYLGCELRRRNRNACSVSSRVNYGKLESILLDTILSKALNDKHFAVPRDMVKFEKAANARRREIDDLKRNLAVVNRTLEEDELEGLPIDLERRERRRDLLRQIPIAEAVLAEAEKELIIAQGQVSPQDHIKRVEEVRSGIDSNDPDIRLTARKKVNDALKGIITTAWLEKDGTLFFALAGGAWNVAIRGGEVVEVADGPLTAMKAGDAGMLRGIAGGSTLIESQIAQIIADGA